MPRVSGSAPRPWWRSAASTCACVTSTTVRHRASPRSTTCCAPNTSSACRTWWSTISGSWRSECREIMASIGVRTFERDHRAHGRCWRSCRARPSKQRKLDLEAAAGEFGGLVSSELAGLSRAGATSRPTRVPWRRSMLAGHACGHRGASSGGAVSPMLVKQPSTARIGARISGEIAKSLGKPTAWSDAPLGGRACKRIGRDRASACGTPAVCT